MAAKGLTVATGRTNTDSTSTAAPGSQTLQRSEAFSDSGRQNTTRLLMPPVFRAVPFSDASTFFGEITDLKAKLDLDRSQAKSVEAGC